MFGLSSIGAGLALKLVAGALVLAALGGAVAYVFSLRATIAEQETVILERTVQRDQEKATAARNRDAYIAAEAQRLVESGMRATADKREAASRRRVADLTREMERASPDHPTLRPTLRPLLRRRVQ